MRNRINYALQQTRCTFQTSPALIACKRICLLTLVALAILLSMVLLYYVPDHKVVTITEEEREMMKYGGQFAGKTLVSIDKVLLCKPNRLGNKMFMIAAAVAAAATQNATFVFSRDKGCIYTLTLPELFPAFRTTVPVFPLSVLEDWWTFSETGFSDFNPIVLHSHNLTVAGYRQSWKYFSSAIERKAVLDIFRFTRKYEKRANTALYNAKRKFNLSHPVVVGLHLRIGDLLGEPRIEYGYQMANKTFYINAIDAVTRHFKYSKSILFIATSDSPQLARKMLSHSSKTHNIAWPNGSDFEDFATLSKCNHSIISGGTFGFWSAWLAGGQTFYYDHFARPDTNFSEIFHSANFYLPHWIPVE